MSDILTQPQMGESVFPETQMDCDSELALPTTPVEYEMVNTQNTLERIDMSSQVEGTQDEDYFADSQVEFAVVDEEEITDFVHSNMDPITVSLTVKEWATRIKNECLMNPEAVFDKKTKKLLKDVIISQATIVNEQIAAIVGGGGEEMTQQQANNEIESAAEAESVQEEVSVGDYDASSDDEGGDKHSKLKRNRLSKNAKKSDRSIGGGAKPTGAVASTELDIMKEIEQGPSEAELARRRLIEGDSDEDERQMLKSNRRALRALKKATRPLILARRLEARKSRAWLRGKMDIATTAKLLDEELFSKPAYSAVAAYVENEEDSEVEEPKQLGATNEADASESKRKVSVVDDLWETMSIGSCSSSEADSDADVAVLRDKEKTEDDSKMIEFSDSDDSDAEQAETSSTPAQIKLEQKLSPNNVVEFNISPPNKSNAYQMKRTHHVVKKQFLKPRDLIRTSLMMQKNGAAAKLSAQQFGWDSREKFKFISEMHVHARNIRSLLKAREEYRVSCDKLQLAKTLKDRAATYMQNANEEEGQYESEDDEIDKEILDAVTGKLKSAKAIIDEETAAKIRAEFANWSDEEDSVDEEAQEELDEEEQLVVLEQEESMSESEEEEVDAKDTTETTVSESVQIEIETQKQDVVMEEVEDAVMNKLPVRRTYGHKSRSIVADDEQVPNQDEGSFSRDGTLSIDSTTVIKDTLLEFDKDEAPLETEALDIPTTVSDSIEGEAEHGSTLDPELAKRIKKIKAKEQNKAFRLELEREEALARSSKSKASILFDDEADEEEEEGMQAGLEDYGFGNIKGKNDSEAHAFRIQKNELDHIVDDNHDDVGDEEEGERRRLAMLMKDDNAATKAVMQTLTKGVRGKRGEQVKSRGRYGTESISALDEEEAAFLKDKAGKDTGVTEDDEDLLDDEERLQNEFLDDMKELGATVVEESNGLSSEDEDEVISDGDSDEEAAEIREKRKHEKLLDKKQLQEWMEISNRRRYFANQKRMKMKIQSGGLDANDKISPTNAGIIAQNVVVPSISRSNSQSLANITALAMQSVGSDAVSTGANILNRSTSMHAPRNRIKTVPHKLDISAKNPRRFQRSKTIGSNSTNSVMSYNVSSIDVSSNINNNYSGSLGSIEKRGVPTLHRSTSSNGFPPALHRSTSNTTISQPPLIRSVSTSNHTLSQNHTSRDLFCATIDKDAMDMGYGLGMAMAPALLRKRKLEIMENSQLSNANGNGSNMGISRMNSSGNLSNMGSAMGSRISPTVNANKLNSNGKNSIFDMVTNRIQRTTSSSNIN